MQTFFGFLSVPGVVILIVGGLLLLKKIVDMERFHELRVALLTTLLSIIAIAIFMTSCLSLVIPTPSDCPKDENVYCQTEY